ncbi:MAG: hypothetical protein PHW75_03450 [Patescibacteria group bacterium]|jgi:bifunctional DNA-binding transcriptional regulator/antitoxin component of YhaV-PrlF toxin-antitoxin module|nr:hypothetical protein [Patescibacteria group bacterium]
MLPLTRRLDTNKRIRLPKYARRVLGAHAGDILVLRISKGERSLRTSLPLNKGGVVYIPTDVQGALGLDAGDILSVEVEEVIKKKEGGGEV